MVFYRDDILVTKVVSGEQVRKLCSIINCHTIRREEPKFQGYCVRHAHEILGIVSTPENYKEKYVPRLPPKPETVYMGTQTW